MDIVDYITHDNFIHETQTSEEEAIDNVVCWLHDDISEVVLRPSGRQ